MIVKTGVCCLDGIVFGEVGGDVDVWRVWIEHCEMTNEERERGEL